MTGQNNNINLNLSSKKWHKGFTGTLNFTNKGDYFDGWTMEFEVPYEIKQQNGKSEIWGAEIVSHEGNRYVIRPVNFNEEVDAQETISITFNAQWLANEIPEPANIMFNGTSLNFGIPEANFSPNEEQITTNNTNTKIDMNFTAKTWYHGFTGTLNFTNEGSAVDDWTMKFDAPYEIRKQNGKYEIWGAEIVSHEGNSYVIRPLDFNQDLDSQETVSITFNAEWLQNEVPEPSNIIFNGVPLDSQPEVISQPEPKTETPIQPEVITPPSTVGSTARPNYNKSTGFFTLNGTLYDANGNEFVPRGVNNRHVWFDDNGDNVNQAYDALDNIASFGFNSVRIVWEVDFQNRSTNDGMLEKIIQKTIDLNMVPMVELHDFTGRTDTNDLLNRGVKWWTDHASLWKKYEKSMMINIANEFGDYYMAIGETRKLFPQVYKEAITRIREAGINSTIVIDPFHYGKDYTLIKEYGKEIYEHDPQKNVVFSVHFYNGEGQDKTKIADAFKSITEQGLPFMVGEFADTHPPGGNIEDEFIMAQAQEYGAGYYAWAWDDGEWAIGSHWEASSKNELTQWGKDLIFNDPNGIAATSKTATIFNQNDFTETEPEVVPEPEPEEVVSQPTTPTVVTQNENSGTGQFNYGEVVQKSLLFYEAQRSGDLPNDNRIEWRGDSSLNDGSDVGLNLSGGYHDAGDHVKFGFPMSQAMTTVAWGGVEYETAYKEMGQWDELLDTVKWATDWMLKAHVNPNGVTKELYVQVGNGDADHNYWGAPEDMNVWRPSYKIDASHPGSDVAAEYAATMASASILFRGENDAYADRLINEAKQLYEFAETYRGKYSDSVTDAQRFYNSWSGYGDELAWGAAWIHKATGEQQYLNKAKSYATEYGVNPGGQTLSWDDKSAGVLVLLAQTGDSKYESMTENWLNNWLNGKNGIQYTTGGLAWNTSWGSLVSSSTTAFLAGVYSDTVKENSKYQEFATQQIDYILGDNPRNSSYVVGFGDNFPKQPHHRAASGSVTGDQDNEHILFGALVGGPKSVNDFDWQDDRDDWIGNEVALNYNAGFTGAAAYLYDKHGGDALSDTQLDLLSGIDITGI